LTSTKPLPKSKPAVGFLLQRKCDCGSPTASLSGACEECDVKRLQSKLTIGDPNDTYEREADGVAEAVLQSSPMANAKTPVISPIMQRPGEQGAGSEQDLPPIVDMVLLSPGTALDVATRSFFEPRFGHDFGEVRVHTDDRAGESAQALHARAYTYGRDVVFGPGQFDPASTGSRRLIAHELVHVVQQSPGTQPRRIQRKVVDDDKHLTCRATRPDALGRLQAGETTATLLAQQAAKAIRDYVPATAGRGETAASTTFRDQVWRRFQLDYNETQPRCTILPELARRFDKIATSMTNKKHRYICAGAGNEPNGECTKQPNVGVAWSTPGGDETEICESSWNDSADEFADTLMHEWFHSIFWVSDCESINVENASCYPTFARELAGTATSADQATCCKPPAGAVPALTVSAETARSCSPPGRLALELKGGVSLNQGFGKSKDKDPAAASAAIDLGLRYSLRQDKLIVVSPFLGVHALYLPSGGRNGDHLLAALAEFGVRFQGINVPLRGVYFDVKAGGYAGFDIPAKQPMTGSQASVTGVYGGSGALGLGYRWERLEVGVEARDLIGTDKTNHVLILGGGTLVF
jgi:hypothetical protein